MHICVYGAANDTIKPAYLDSAYRLGQTIAEAGHTMVFGGGCTGVMGAAAKGVLSREGKLIGIAPAFFHTPGILEENCTELILTETMRERKDLLEQKSGRLQLDGRWMLQLQRGVLQTVENRSAEPMAPVCIDGEHIPENPLASGRLCAVNYEQFKNLQEQDCNILKNAIDCDKICGRIFLRSKIEGDSLRPIRRGVTKPLRKWWNELGIPPQNRGLLPVLADEKGPVWAAGLGVDERVAVDETSTNIQVIKIQEEQP